MSLRTPATCRFALVTIVLAAVLAPPIFAARSTPTTGKAAGPARPPAAATLDETVPTPGGPAPVATPKPPHGARPAPASTAAAGIKPANHCGSCDDGDPCTVDRCDEATGQCIHPAVVCDDVNPCTSDSCDPQTGCRFEAVDDGTVCGGVATCQTGGGCPGG